MSDFFEEVGHIKSLMSQIRTNIKIIQDTYTKSTWGEVGQETRKYFSWEEEKEEKEKRNPHEVRRQREEQLEGRRRRNPS
jgi:hypothetical protein